MLKQVTGTIAARVFGTGMNLVVIMLAGHALGAPGLGAISLITLGITLVMLPANLLGGGALVYLVPRVALSRLLVPAYSCAVISVLLAYAVMLRVPLVPDGLVLHVCLLAFLQAIYSVHLGVLLGEQRIARHNLITTLNAAILLIAFSALIFRGSSSVMDYVVASYAAFGLTVVSSAWAMRGGRPVIVRSDRADLKFMFMQGLWVQGANGLQLINYRLAYKLIDHFQGTSPLGVYSVGNQLAESAWIAPRSLGMVLLSRVSNTHSADLRRKLTLTTMKLALTLATVVIILLLIMPEAVFSLAFGKEIHGLHPIILALAPGILSMAASQAFSHYFSGTGHTKVNLIGSAFGVAITAGTGPWLVEHHGLIGAALTASAAYGASATYQLVVFMRRTQSMFRELWPTGADVERGRELWRAFAPSGK